MSGHKKWADLRDEVMADPERAARVNAIKAESRWRCNLPEKPIRIAIVSRFCELEWEHEGPCRFDEAARLEQFGNDAILTPINDAILTPENGAAS